VIKQSAITILQGYRQPNYVRNWTQRSEPVNNIDHTEMAPSGTTLPNAQVPIASNYRSRDAKIDIYSKYSNRINGIASTTSEKHHGFYPSTLEALPDVPVSTKEDVETAVRSAREAFKKWKAVPVKERQAAVTKYSMLKH
jgi:hypothetical protein